jgi:hypothetical protein
MLGIAIALSAPAAAQSGDPGFGRFFTTPRTRSELDNARENYTLDRPPPRDPREEQAADRPQQVQLNGMILRSDGSGQAWINGSPKGQIGGSVESVTIDTAGARPRAVVTLPGGERVTLRPGEVFSLESGRVRDAFQHKAAEPEPEAPEENETTEQDGDKTADHPEAEAFDESELADQDSRILLLEKRLEKLESSIKTDETTGDASTESERN